MSWLVSKEKQKDRYSHIKLNFGSMLF